MYKKYLLTLEARWSALMELLKKVDKAKENLNVEQQVLARKQKDFEEEKLKLRELYKQKYKGFPIIAETYEQLLAIEDRKEEAYFMMKIRKAESTAERVQLINSEKRKYAKDAAVLQKKLDVCIQYVPDLLDILDQEFVDDELEAGSLPYSEEEREDRVTYYLTVEEYRSLSTTEKNQLALDRYKKRRKDSKGIGNMYERYVGYLFESEGYDVTYEGILKGRKDRGIDLIASKGEEMHVIQCKNWSKYKTIFENAIFQLYGSWYHFSLENPKNKVIPQFYTTTSVDDFAKHFCEEVGIKVIDSHKIDYDYPMVKCNVAREGGEKIYHLPMDQQYDKVKIEINRDEFYCHSVEEAEKVGFRRAFKWKGDK